MMVYRTSSIKRKRRTKAEIAALKSSATAEVWDVARWFLEMAEQIEMDGIADRETITSALMAATVVAESRQTEGRSAVDQ